ncbi:MAG: carbohydrate kinase [Anaerolineae bacterium]|nr:carbohydrate kinase [Anaerolineae bacterium]
MPGTILTIDHGTQSIRALLFTPNGTLLAKYQVKIQPYVSPQPGWAEQNPEYFWGKVCEACRGLLSSPGVDASSIIGLSITTQRSTLLNLDKNGNPLRPVIHWLDQRIATQFKPVKGLWGLVFDLIGMRDTINYFQSQAEANWILENQPEIWDKTDKFVFLSAYLIQKLSGNLVDSVASQVGYIPFDYKKHQWCSPGDWKWLALPQLRREQLPDLVQPGTIMGQVTRSAAAATGIPEGIPIIAAAADKACEVLGSGCTSPETACLSFGTTATINTTLTRYVEVIPLVPPYPSAVPQAYSLEIQIFRGYWMVEWFKREFAHEETRLALERNIQAEQLFDELINAAPAGSMGLMLQPFWSPGVKVPGPEAKGSIIGFGDVHTRSHLYRAIIEGLGYALREGMERTINRTRVPITSLVIAGGGSQSNAAMQVTADIFGLPTSRPSIYEASGLGAAIDAAVGLGVHPDFPSAVKAMTSIRDTISPNPENHKIYDDLYQHVYQKMYKKLQPLYEQIRQITGYPPSF